MSVNPDPENHKYSSYDNGFDENCISLFDGSEFGKSMKIFGADMSSSVYIDNKKQDILSLCKGPTQGLDITTLTAKK